MKIDRFVPILANYDTEQIDIVDNEIHQNLGSIETGSIKTVMVDNQLNNQNILDTNLTGRNIEKKDSLIAFGKRVSKEEIDELVENIPFPPT